MEFFIPDPSDDRKSLPAGEAETLYEAIRKGAEVEFGHLPLDRRIFRITYRHNGAVYTSEVGKFDPLQKETVMAILDMGNVLSVRCEVRGVWKVGEPILVGHHAASSIEEFAPNA